MELRLGAAGLGIGAFSGVVDLLHLCSRSFSLWKDLRGLDQDVRLLRARLMVQEAGLEHWKRDWYGASKTGFSSTQRRRQLKSHEEVVRSALEQLKGLLDRMEPLRQAVASRGTERTAIERVQWVATKKAEAEKDISAIESLLTGIYRFLPPRIPDFQAAKTLLYFNDAITEDDLPSESPDPPLQILSNAPTVNHLFRLRRLERSLGADLQKRIDDFRVALPTPDLSLLASRVQVERPDRMAAGSRSFGLLDNATPVMIEWKKYNPSWQGKQAIRSKGRIDNLARLLHAESKPKELQTFHCVGYFDQARDSRYGFVFQYPPDVGSTVVSLRELLDHYRSVEQLPTLENRYQVAFALSLSLSVLHSVDWLHKSIRSHNVLFTIYRPAEADEIVWSHPYLTGFEFSRPDRKDELSEKPEESAKYNIYRHLQSQGIPSESFRKAFDAYSLGVVLLEIGLWRAAWKLREDNMNPAQIHASLIQHATERLAHCMGVEYRDVTLACLKGELESSEDDFAKDFFIEVVEVLGRYQT